VCVGFDCTTEKIKIYLYKVIVGQLEGKRPLGRPGIGERIILKWMLRN
jgi:hypothetical protein